jgi:putative DNA primase/helicase
LEREPYQDLTGDAMISARYMRGNFFEFKRTHKHLVLGNHRPMLRIVDEGIRRRLHVVPFKAHFEGDNCDPLMPEKLRAEAPQILHWLIEGHRRWKADGRLIKCAAVEAETQDYFDAQNTNENWLTERCLVGPRYSQRAKELYRDYRDWTESRGEVIVSQTRWGDWMGQRFNKRTSNGVIYDGIGLIDGLTNFQ